MTPGRPRSAAQPSSSRASPEPRRAGGGLVLRGRRGAWLSVMIASLTIASLAIALYARSGREDGAGAIGMGADAYPADYFDPPDWEGSEAELEGVAAALRARIAATPSDALLHARLAHLREEQADSRERAGLPHEEYVRKALDSYRRSAELRPGAWTPDLGTNLEAVARLLVKLGEREEAARWFHRATEVGYACPHLALGSLYRRAGDVAGAEQSLREALELRPDRRDGRFLMALHLFETGRLDEARAQLDAEPKPSPGPASGPRVRGRGPQADVGVAPFLTLRGFILLLDQDYAAAERVFDDCATRFGRSRLALVGLAHLANARKDYAGARRHLEEALRAPAHGEDIDPYVLEAIHDFEDGMWRLGSAWIEGNTGHHDAAVGHYRAILESRPSHTLALLGLGNSLTALGREDEASKVFQRVLALDPGNAHALAGLGTLALNRNALPEAEELLERAKEAGDERYSCPYEGLGLLFLRQGKDEEAAAHFEEAIERNPGAEYRKYDGLARIFVGQGRLEEARALLRKSLRNHPEGNDARELLEQVEERLAANPVTGQ